MHKIFKTSKKPFILALELKSTQPVKVKVEAQDLAKPNNYYCKKQVDVNGLSKYRIKIPTTPNELVFKIYPASYDTYEDYVRFGKNQIKKFDIVRAEVLSIGSPMSRYAQNIAEDAVIISEK